MALRPQPHRLQYPLSAAQVESLDEMLADLFKTVRSLEGQIATAPVTTVVQQVGGVPGPPGTDGEEGAAGTAGPPGATGATGPTGPTGASGVAAPISVGATTTVSTGTGFVAPEALEIQAGISFEIEGGGRVEITGPACSPANIQVATTYIPAAQVLFGFSHPITIVPAPGANKMVVPLFLTVHNVETGYNVGRAFSVKYTLTSGAVDASQNDVLGPSTLTTTAAHDRWFIMGPSAISSFFDKNTPASGGGSPINKALVLLPTADMSTYGASTDNMKVVVVYCILEGLT